MVIQYYSTQNISADNVGNHLVLSLDKVTVTGNSWHFFVICEYVRLKWCFMLLVQLLQQWDQLDVM